MSALTKRFGLSLVVGLVALQSAQAAIVTVDVTIKSVNSQARGITVVYDTNLGQKSIELDVSRKAKITVNGKEGTLDSLGEGLKAKVSYDKDLVVITRIEATGMVMKRKAPELVEVSELNPGRMPWLSEDGMTIYWVKEDGIYSARRSDANSFFEDRRLLFKGGTMPSLTSDGLEMVLVAARSDGKEGASLHAATRETVSGQFKRPAEIVEFADAQRPWSPCLTPDGLKLYFSRLKADVKRTYELVVSTRPTRNTSWTKPQPVDLVRDNIQDGDIAHCFVASDGLTMLAAHMGSKKDMEKKGNLMFWWRSSMDEPFAKFRHVQIEGSPPVSGASPRWVRATNELFFTRIFPDKDEKSFNNIWVIRNFVPPIDVKGYRASGQ